MLIVTMKSKEHAYTIPVPYAVLRLASAILTSGFVHRIARRALSKYGGHSTAAAGREHEAEWAGGRFWIELAFSILDNRNTKQAIRQLFRELQRCKGTVLFDARAQDGTGLLIRL